MLKHLDSPNEGDELEPNSKHVYEQKIANLQTRVAYLERIAEVSQVLNSTLELGPLLKVITQAGIELANTEGCSILLYDDNTDGLKFMPSTFSPSEDIDVPLDGSIAGLIFRKARPVLIRDVKDDPRWNNAVDQANDFKTRSILGVPLKIKNEVIGVMELVNKQDEAGFGQEDIQIATALASQAAVAIENARLLEEVQRAFDELAELDRIKSDFVSVASHELRTPLAVILGYASFLRDQVSGEATEQLDMVLSSAIKLRGLIDDMVNLRHVQNEEVQLSLDIFSMQELLREVLAEFNTLISAKTLKVKVRLDEGETDSVDIEADRQKIYLVVANIISNAIKFTPERGFILISLGRQEGMIYLHIADTGVGIPKDYQDKIFEEFYQVEPSITRRFEGMGLGLPIVKGMVDIHKGEIFVKSVEGRGSQFSIFLPISTAL